MVPKVADNGASFKGAAAYYLHDKDADTADRVDWTHTENLPTNNPDLAWRVMAFTAMDGQRVKRENGVRGGGNKLAKPVFSFSLSWHTGQKPDKAHILETAKDAVAQLGLTSYQALFVAHKDEPQPHVHIIINRVHPETGIAVNIGNGKNRLSDWALEYQRKHGEDYCPQRVVNARKRKERKLDKTKPIVSYRDPVIVAAWEQSDNGKSFQAALNAQGYRLAKGNKRTVVVDRWGKVQNPTRQLGLRTDAFRARCRDIDLDRLPDAAGLQQQAKKQARHEYHASRKWDKWSILLKNEMQDRQIDERAKLSDKFQRQLLAKRDELIKFYKFEDHKVEIARLKAATLKPSLARKLTGKDKADREELARLEQIDADGRQKMADALERIEHERAQAFATQDRRHAEEQNRALDLIVEKKPEFYREEIVKDLARQKKPERDRDGGRSLEW